MSKYLWEIERDAIIEALERNQGDKDVAAVELGISLKTLYNKLHKYGDMEKYYRKRPRTIPTSTIS